jgi:Family of unknown function (DUF5677)
MGFDPAHVRQTDEAFQYFVGFMRALRPIDEETGAFYHIVTALSDVARSNYLDLRRALDGDDQIVMAWACRNLLEVAIFAKYVIMSKENAKEFADARLIDGLDIANSLKKLELFQNQTLTVSSFELLIDAFTQQLTMEGVSRTSFLGTRELARKVGMQDIYETMNKVCSKFVHPTAWSILTSDIGSKRFPDARDLLFLCGAEYFSAVHAEIIPHVKKWGLHHAP